MVFKQPVCVAPPLMRNNSRRIYVSQYSAFICACLWPHRRDLRFLGPQLDSFPRRRQCPYARNCGSHSNRRICLFSQTIQNHRHGGLGPGRTDCLVPRPIKCRRFCAGCGSLGCLRFYWHERVGQGQCAYRPSRDQRHWPSAGCCFSWRRHHRHVGGWSGSFGCDRFLLVSHLNRCARRRQSTGCHAQSPDRFCFRFVADFHLRPFGRRHFHQRR